MKSRCLRWRVLTRRKQRLGLLLCVLGVCLYLLMKKERFLPVVIVEEHHEALVYWIDAAEDRIIWKADNTLIHIDAHSDAALPAFIPGMPLFTWPQSDFEVDTLLQKNDVFIMDAVMLGLIDRFIWLVPAWDEETRDVHHHVEQAELGYAMLKGQLHSSGELTPYLCKCEYNERDVRSCVFYNDSITPSPRQQVEPLQALHAALCQHSKTYTFEVLSVRTATQLLSDDGDWIEEGESVILDVDEDYFGVELPGTRLIDAGISWQTLQLLDTKLAAIFCPRIIDHEETARGIIHDILDMYSQMCSQAEYLNYCRRNLQNIVNKMLDTVLIEAWRNDPELFCAQNDGLLRKTVKEFIQTIQDLTLNQLSVLREVSFCLNTSPRTFGFPELGRMSVCHGANNPEEPFVQLYKANTVELQRELIIVQDFLNQLPELNLVTICRSSRDGYTPRDQIARIESELLRTFERGLFKNTGLLPFRLIYNENLMNPML